MRPRCRPCSGRRPTAVKRRRVRSASTVPEPGRSSGAESRSCSSKAGGHVRRSLACGASGAALARGCSKRRSSASHRGAGRASAWRIVWPSMSLISASRRDEVAARSSVDRPQGRGSRLLASKRAAPSTPRKVASSSVSRAPPAEIGRGAASRRRRCGEVGEHVGVIAAQSGLFLQSLARRATPRSAATMKSWKKVLSGGSTPSRTTAFTRSRAGAGTRGRGACRRSRLEC